MLMLLGQATTEKNSESGTVKLFILVANQFHQTLDSPQPHADCSTTVIHLVSYD